VRATAVGDAALDQCDSERSLVYGARLRFHALNTVLHSLPSRAGLFSKAVRGPLPAKRDAVRPGGAPHTQGEVSARMRSRTAAITRNATSMATSASATVGSDASPG
jgi:hypothetical protein